MHRTQVHPIPTLMCEWEALDVQNKAEYREAVSWWEDPILGGLTEERVNVEPEGAGVPWVQWVCPDVWVFKSHAEVRCWGEGLERGGCRWEWSRVNGPWGGVLYDGVCQVEYQRWRMWWRSWRGWLWLRAQLGARPVGMCVTREARCWWVAAVQGLKSW